MRQTFFAGLNVEVLDFAEAQMWFEQGRDPMDAPVPFHPSFEDRPGVPDRVFASLDVCILRGAEAIPRIPPTIVLGEPHNQLSAVRVYEGTQRLREFCRSYALGLVVEEVPFASRQEGMGLFR